MKFKLIIILSILFLYSCENEEQKFWRKANDRYFYQSENGYVHLDIKCKMLNNKAFIPKLKSEGYESFLNPFIFCHECCTVRDIEKFKSQLIKNN